jgi:Domain of unknown function (DUF4389)
VWTFIRGIGIFFVVGVGWFAALITGRMPSSFARAISNFLIYSTRVSYYANLMNDTYPPFSSSAPFEVNLDLPTSRVRRWAVLFRYFMLIPAGLVNSLISLGMSICSVFIWLIVLVKGEMPRPLFGAVAAIMRFQVRANAYAFMLTGKYPGELFGDVAVLISEVTPGADELTAPNAESPSQPPQMNTAAPLSYGTPAPPITLPYVTTTEPGGSSEASSTARLDLSRGAKNILVLFLILGALGYAAIGVIDAKIVRNAVPLTDLEIANNVLVSQVNAAKAQSAACTQGQAACARQYFSVAANDFRNFGATVSSISFPSSAQADSQRLLRDATVFYTLLDRLSMPSNTFTSAEESQLQSSGNAFDTAYARLLAELSPTI